MESGEGEEHPDQWKKYPRKPVTFPSQDHMARATEYCKKNKVGFSELVRKLLAEHMRAEDAIAAHSAPTIRVIKEPGK